MMFFRVADASTPSCARDQLDRRRPRRLDLHHRIELGIHDGRRHLRRRRLGVGEVVAVRASHEQILANVGERHELVVDVSPDRARIGFDDHVVQPDPVEDALVRLVHHAVALHHARFVTVERVGVLHQELAAAEQPEPGSLLVAVLPLDLEQVDRQIAVAGQIVRDERREDLLMGGAEYHLAPVAVLELEGLVAVDLPSPGGLPRIGRQHDRHPHLDRPGGLHLLADDRLDRAHDTQREWQRRVHAGAHTPHEARPHQQPVRRDLGVGRIVAERRHEELRETHQAHRIPAGPTVIAVARHTHLSLTRRGGAVTIPAMSTLAARRDWRENLQTPALTRV